MYNCTSVRKVGAVSWY